MSETGPAWLPWLPGGLPGGPAPWVALVALGAYHGINPAMGWLFAVALGLQQRRRAAVLGALLPIALGHEASIAVAVALAGGAQLVAAPAVLRPLAAAALIAFGLYKFVRPRSHPRWVGMRVGPRDLVLWSFLMSSVHGAGLMLVPIVLGLPAGNPSAGAAAEHVHAADGPHVHVLEGGVTSAALAQDATAVVVHTLAMLLAMAAVAVLVYEKLGVAVLRVAPQYTVIAPGAPQEASRLHGAVPCCAAPGSTSTCCGPRPSSSPACSRCSPERPARLWRDP